MLSYALQLVYPPRCRMCGELMPVSKEQTCFCGICRVKWESYKNEICPRCRYPVYRCVCVPKYNKTRVVDSFRSLILYRGDEVRHLIGCIKWEKDQAASSFIASELAMMIYRYSRPDPDEYILAYPQRSRASYKKYGIDQAKTFCRKISKYTGIPVFDGIKHKNGPQQKELGAEQRGVNAANSYYIPDKYTKELKGKRIIFIDDVITTGATCVVCAALCKTHGAKSFSAYSIARTP